MTNSAKIQFLVEAAEIQPQLARLTLVLVLTNYNTLVKTYLLRMYSTTTQKNQPDDKCGLNT